MPAARVAGQEDAAALAALAVGPVRRKRAASEHALTGKRGGHQRVMRDQPLSHSAAVEEQIASVGERIAERRDPCAAAVVILDAMPGSGRWSAQVILAAIGPDRSRFPDAGSLAGWAGRRPGHHERAGQRRSGHPRPGSPWLRVTGTEAAEAAGRSEDTDRAGCSGRIIARRGKTQAASAGGRSMLELGPLRRRAGQLDDDQKARARPTPVPLSEEHRLGRQSEQLGHRLPLEPAT